MRGRFSRIEYPFCAAAFVRGRLSPYADAIFSLLYGKISEPSDAESDAPEEEDEDEDEEEKESEGLQASPPCVSFSVSEGAPSQVAPLLGSPLFARKTVCFSQKPPTHTIASPAASPTTLFTKRFRRRDDFAPPRRASGATDYPSASSTYFSSILPSAEKFFLSLIRRCPPE